MTQASMDIEARPLPAGWKWVKLGDVCGKSETIDPKKSAGRLFTYIDISSVDRDEKRVVNPDSVLGQDAPSRARRVVKNGDILVSTTRPNLNAVALVDSSLDGEVCSTGFCVLRPKPNAISNYIFHFVRSEGFIQSLSGLVSGALYPAVTDNQVYQQDIPLPPLEEQKRIAAILNEQMASVEKAKKAAEERLEAAKALAAAYLREVFEGEAAEEWVFQPFGQFIIEARNGFGRRPRGEETGPIVLRIADVSSGYVDLSSPRRVDMTPKESNTYSLNPGDLLFIRVNGSPNYVGKCIHVTKSDGDLAYNDHLIRVRLQNVLEPDFMVWFLASERVRQHMVVRASTSAGQLTINRAAIDEIRIPVIDRCEQKKIAGQLEDIMTGVKLAEASIQQELGTIRAMPAAILRKAFAGEL